MDVEVVKKRWKSVRCVLLVFDSQFHATFTSAECIRLPGLSARLYTLPADIIFEGKFETADQQPQEVDEELFSSVIS